MKFKLYASATLVAIAGLLGATQATAQTYTQTSSSWGADGIYYLFTEISVASAKRIKTQVSVSNLPAGAKTSWLLARNGTTFKKGNGPGTYTTPLAFTAHSWILFANVQFRPTVTTPVPTTGRLTNKITVITPS